jgi:hypothetical protein
MSSGLQTRHSTLIQEAFAQGLQSFVKTSALRTATTNTGTPAAGTFYSTIVGRAPITDISQDLRVSFGIDRIMTQQLTLLQNEFGPNGEPVRSTPNDTNGMIRFVGQWNLLALADGAGVQCAGPGDYIEVTFYGTGLNLLAYNYPAYVATVSIDGGTAGSNVFSGATASTVIQGRNYGTNPVLQAASGLTLGVHTARILVTASNPAIYGFEILNASAANSNLNVNPGTAYIDGLKTTATAAQSLAYNAAVTGSRGGRVVTYLKDTGSIAQAFQPANAAAAFLTAADHTNEEVARTHFPREFGAGRSPSSNTSDDFSIGGGTSNKSFTLDDGTTSLVAQNGVISFQGAVDGLAPAGSGDFVQFTFVGTGLDIVSGIAATATTTITVDGTAISTSALNFSTIANYKVASGLPYGTHTVKITNTSNAVSPRIAKFVVYQPKKPSVPTGAIELADYNVMATYAASSALNYSTPTPSVGILAKAVTRELIYVGTWSIVQDVTNLSGYYTATSTNGDYFEYSFFGTGIEIVGSYGSSATTQTIMIDGSAYTGAATATQTTTWTPGTSTWAMSSSGGLQISGLALGLHKLRVTKASGGQFIIPNINVITPIHSAKSNQYGDLQNTLSVGSQAMSDSRQTTPVKNALPNTKARAMAIGLSENVTTTSTASVPMPDMSVTMKTGKGYLDISWVGSIINATINAYVFLFVYVDGVQVGPRIQWRNNTSGNNSPQVASHKALVPVEAGTHKVDIYWNNFGSGTAEVENRVLTVAEI